MKIIRNGKGIAELPDKPKNFEAGCKGGKVSILVGDKEVELAQYERQEEAREVLTALRKNYLAGQAVFSMP